MEKPVLAAVKGSCHWHRVFDLIERGTIPFVSAPNGAVAGGGFELAAAAHVRAAEMSNSTIFNALPGIEDMSSEDGRFLESIMSALTPATPEAGKRLRAFLEKRAANVAGPE